MNPLQKYMETQNGTASRERLLVLLLEASLRHMRTAAVALEHGDTSKAQEPLAKAIDIVGELLATLNCDQSPELCQNLSELYYFVSGRLLQGALTKNPVYVHEAERAFAPIVDAFSTAVAQMAQSESETKETAR